MRAELISRQLGTQNEQRAQTDKLDARETEARLLHKLGAWLG